MRNIEKYNIVLEMYKVNFSSKMEKIILQEICSQIKLTNSDYDTNIKIHLSDLVDECEFSRAKLEKNILLTINKLMSGSIIFELVDNYNCKEFYLFKIISQYRYFDNTIIMKIPISSYEDMQLDSILGNMKSKYKH